MGIVIVGIVTVIFLATYIARRRRARLSRIREQYMSPAGLRWLRAHIPVVDGSNAASRFEW
jgi:hypothetical protein